MDQLVFREPMEAKLISDLPSREGWQFEPKWDGFRCIAIKDGHSVELWGKSGKPLGRYFPEVTAMVHELPFERLSLDGELIIAVDGKRASTPCNSACIQRKVGYANSLSKYLQS